jgi:hypothetical protein
MSRFRLPRVSRADRDAAAMPTPLPQRRQYRGRPAGPSPSERHDAEMDRVVALYQRGVAKTAPERPSRELKRLGEGDDTREAT